MTNMTDNAKPQRMKAFMNFEFFHNCTTEKPSSFVKGPSSSGTCHNTTSTSLPLFARPKRKCTFDVGLGSIKTKSGTEIVSTPTQVPADLQNASASPSRACEEGLSPPLFLSPSPLSRMTVEPSPPASVSFEHSFARKQKSLVISPNLNALLNSEEDHERYTNTPPSIQCNEADKTSRSLHFTAEATLIPFHFPYSPRSPQFPQSSIFRSPGSRSGTSHPPPASPHSLASPFLASHVSGNNVKGDMPDSSLISLDSRVQSEPLLKSLPPPPRLRKRRAKTGDKDVTSRPLQEIRLGSMTAQAGPKSRPLVNPGPHPTNAATRVSWIEVGKDTTETTIVDKLCWEQDCHTRQTPSELIAFKSLESISPPTSIVSLSESPKISTLACDNSRSLLPITSPPTLIQNRTSYASDSPDSSSIATSLSSSSSTSTVTPGKLEMEIRPKHKDLRSPSLSPNVASPKLSLHSIRHSRSAHNLNHRSAPPTVYASTKIMDRKTSRRVKVLSAEDVLGELCRKEDALDTLRILARTGTGITNQEEVSLPVSRSSSRYSRTSGKSRSTQGLEERVGTSFLTMTLENDDEEDDSDSHGGHMPLSDSHDTYSAVPPAGTTSTVPRVYPPPSSEVSVMHLDEEHASEVHPYSGYYSGSERSIPCASTAGSVSLRTSSSASGLSYVYSRTEGGGVSKVSKMGSEAGSIEVHGGDATAANVVVQGVNNDEVSHRSQYRRQRPPGIFILPTEDKNGVHLQYPTSSNSDALPQLPRLIPPSPLSASFERSLGLSSSTPSGLALAPSSPVTSQSLSDSEDFSFSQQRSSFITVRTSSEESSFSRRPGSISTIAFGNLKSAGEKEIYEIPLDSDKDSSSNFLHGYEGDYNSASAESSTEGEVDFTKYYQRRVSEDLQHVHHTYRAARSRRQQQRLKKSKGKETQDQFTKQYRRKTIQMDGRGISLYSSAEDHERYLNEVEIIDMRVETQRGMPGQLRRLRSNSHAIENVEPGSTAAFDSQYPCNTNRRYTTLTTNTTPSSPDGISTTLSAFHFVDEDPWSSTEYEREFEAEDPRISISSTVYSESYYDPYDVLPTPRTVPSLPYHQARRHSEIRDTMRRGVRSEYSELEDRVSFMDLVSPTAEGKPPLPTTPKPDFSTFRSAGRSSRSLERGAPNQEHGRRPHKFSTPNTRSNSRANSNEDLEMQPPPTSNTLDPLSRADLVRKSRKLAQVFGQTPNGASLLPTTSAVLDSSVRRSFLDITSPTTSRHHNSNSIAAFRKSSVGDAKEKLKENVDRVKGKGIWAPPPSTRYMSVASGRRHSTPLTPDELEFLGEVRSQDLVADHRASSILGSREDGNLIEIGDAQEAEGDRASFIDWDDESPTANESKGKGRNTHPVELLTQSPSGSQSSSRRTSVSSLAFAPPSNYPGGAPRNSFMQEDFIGTELPVAPFDDVDDEGQKRDLQQQHLTRQPSLFSLITPSLMSPEERAEAEKRRKREKLAKLHRFLGSRVPTGLVLGQADEDSETGLPGLSASSMGEETDAEGSSEEKRSWKKGMARVTRRRSGSESGISSDWSDIRDRRKDDMGEDEKLRMVKRAVRLEKVFGVAPPQTLYAYGHGPHHPHSNSAVTGPSVAPMIRSSSTGAAEAHLTFGALPPKRSHTRPASREFLLPKDKSTDQQAIEIEAGDVSATLRVSRPRGASLAYTHYEHSLNSLDDILDREDRASLKELHEILYQADETEHVMGGIHAEPEHSIDIDPPGYTSGLSSGSIRSERRRSLPALPARTSIASLNSIDSVGSKVVLDDADLESSEGTFQVRRRRAAKLTQFFGVDYRDLVQDVLDSIENGVELERGRGLSRQEAEDLLRKLRTIKGKRTGIFS